MKLSEFVLFKNTPPLQINKTIHFHNNTERDNFFINNFEKLSFESLFNFRKDRGVVQFPLSYENFIGYEYGYFIDGFENTKYYFFVTNYEYINDSVTKASILIDTVMTFTQGNVLNNLRNIDIERQHLTKINYESMLKYLRMNDDSLNTFTKLGITRKEFTFKNFYVLITSSANFEGDFGTEETPKLPFSNGSVYDNITSPLNLYLFKFEQFNNCIKYLEEFSWIAQNIVKCVMLPSQMIDENDLQEISFKNNTDLKFYKLKNKGLSRFDIDFNYTINDLLSDCGLTNDDLYLLKSNYVNIYLTDYSGNKIVFDSSKVNTLDFGSMVSVGYQNLIKIFLKGYESKDGIKSGTYLDYTLTIDDFDELPVYINNSQLQKSKSAYTRQLENDKTVSGKISKIQNGNTQDKIFNSLSLFSNVFIGGNILSSVANLYSQEYDYYRQQKAQFKEMDLTPPTVTIQNTNHSVQIKSGDYGIFLHVFAISPQEFLNIKKYHAQYGFEVNLKQSYLSNIDSMSLCNFVKFTGAWKIQNIDIIFNDTLRNIFENGVLLYKPVSKNPFEIDILNNERVM